MTCDLPPLQLYFGHILMEGCEQWNPFMIEKIFAAQFKPGPLV